MGKNKPINMAYIINIPIDHEKIIWLTTKYKKPFTMYVNGTHVFYGIFVNSNPLNYSGLFSLLKKDYKTIRFTTKYHI